MGTCDGKCCGLPRRQGYPASAGGGGHCAGTDECKQTRWATRLLGLFSTHIQFFGGARYPHAALRVGKLFVWLPKTMSSRFDRKQLDNFVVAAGTGQVKRVLARPWSSGLSGVVLV